MAGSKEKEARHHLSGSGAHRLLGRRQVALGRDKLEALRTCSPQLDLLVLKPVPFGRRSGRTGKGRRTSSRYGRGLDCRASSYAMVLWGWSRLSASRLVLGGVGDKLLDGPLDPTVALCPCAPRRLEPSASLDMDIGAGLVRKG